MQPCKLQQLGADQPVHLVAFHEQHAGAGQLRAGLGQCVGVGGLRTLRAARRLQLLHHGLEQLGRGHRLGQHDLEVSLADLRFQVLGRGGRHQDDLRALAERQRTDDARALHAIELGHQPVHHHQPVRAALRVHVRDGLDRRRPVAHGVDVEVHAAQALREQLARGQVVVDDQQARAPQGLLRHQGLGPVGPDLQSGREPEGGAHARLAGNADIAAHQACKVHRDGQPQPGAAEAPCQAAVDLLELLEQPALVLGCDADAGVADLHAQRLPALGGTVHGRDAHDHLPALGELDGVAEVVEQNLAEPLRVAAQVTVHLRRDVDDQLEPLGLGALAQEADGAGDHRLERELLVRQRQAARLDLAEVEDVVDDPQQVLAGGLDLLQVAALPIGELGAQDQVRQADDGVHRRADLVADVGDEAALGVACLEVAVTSQRGQQADLQALGGQLGLFLVVVDLQVPHDVQRRRGTGVAGAHDQPRVVVAEFAADELHQVQPGVLGLHDHVDEGHGDVGFGLEDPARRARGIRRQDAQPPTLELQALEHQS